MERIKSYLRTRAVLKSLEEIIQTNDLGFVHQKHFDRFCDSINQLQPCDRVNCIEIIQTQLKVSDKNPKKLLKFLMALHQLKITNAKYELYSDFTEILQNACCHVEDTEGKISKFDAYLISKFVLPYIHYLLKCFSQISDQQSKLKSFDMENSQQKNPKQGIEDYVPQKTEDDFLILAKLSQILRMKNALNQMARYYEQHQYIICLFLQLLKDIKIYLHRIQSAVDKISQQCAKGQNKELDNNQILFVTQAERVFNQSYGFVFNKYLYFYINTRIDIRVQLKIPSRLLKILNEKTNANKSFVERNEKRSITKSLMCISQTQDTSRHQLELQESIASFKKFLYDLKESQ